MRNGQAGLFQNLFKEHLVGAPDHGLCIVDDGHAFLLGAAGEFVGVIVDLGRGPDEQRIELGKTGQVGRLDRLDLDAHLGRNVCEALDGGGFRRRRLLMRIDQHGQSPFGGGLGFRLADPTAGIGFHRFEKEVPAFAFQLVRRDHPDTANAVRRFRVQFHFQCRYTEPVGNFAGEALIARRFRLREGNEQAFDLRRALGMGFAQAFAKIGQGMAVESLGRQLDHGLDAGADPVAARLCE